jgi:hypothetical protein
MVGILYSHWLSKKSIVLEMTEVGPTEYSVRIINLSLAPIVVTEVLVDLGKDETIPVVHGVSGVFPVTVRAHGGAWQWPLDRGRIPSNMNCDKRCRAVLMDGSTLKSIKGKRRPHMDVFRMGSS